MFCEIQFVGSAPDMEARSMHSAYWLEKNNGVEIIIWLYMY